MKRKILFGSMLVAAVCFLILSSCSSPDKQTDTEKIVMEQPDTVLFWTVDDYNKVKSRVYKDTVTITDPQRVINGINSLYPDVKLKFLKLSGDTVYASIDSAFAYTNDMGSFGATEYLSTVVLNLTTLNNINFVNLDFVEGSHASPGVFAKSNYLDYKLK